MDAGKGFCLSNAGLGDSAFPLDYLDIYLGFKDYDESFDDLRVFKSSLCLRKGGLHWYAEHHIEDTPYLLCTDKNGEGVVTWKYIDINDLQGEVGLLIGTREFCPKERPKVSELKEPGLKVRKSE